MSPVEGMKLERIEPPSLAGEPLAEGLTFYAFAAPTGPPRSGWTWYYAVGPAGCLQLVQTGILEAVDAMDSEVGGWLRDTVSAGFGWDAGIHRRVDQGEECPVPELDGHCDFTPDAALGWKLGASITRGEGDVWQTLTRTYWAVFGA